jgi:long-chain acyl-CoA synthetase
MSIATINDLFQIAAGHDKDECLQHKVDGKYVSIPTEELVENVRRLATALDAMGIQPGDRIALMAENGPHWPTVDFAVLAMGGVLVPIYPTLTSDQAAYIVNDCGAEIVFVQGNERLEGLLSERANTPGVKKYVVIDGQAEDPTIPALQRVLADTPPMEMLDLTKRANLAQPDDLATFIYTSGTTGNPKGVMLTHGNIATNVVNCLKCMNISDDQVALSFLPLSHSFERTIDYIYFFKGVTIAYAESVQTVGENFGEVKPHMFVSVPRVYEKVLARVHENVAKSSGLKQKIFHWAEGVARDALPYRIAETAAPGLLGIKVALADKLVFGKLKERLGGRFEFAFSGGAPLSPDIAQFFWGAGIQIYEGYGLSETSPVLTVNRPGATKMGHVGKAIPDTELKIAEDGEILAKGPQIMKGYWNLAEETAEAIDADGWFHTGDIGEIDDEGFLKITDRKKEIIVNAYGKNVAPAPIENSLKASRFIEQAVVIGDKRKFLSALIVPDFATLEIWAGENSIDTDDRKAMLADEKTRDLFTREIEAVNAKLAKYELIRAFDLVPGEFTIETGELTPTQKIKRRVIHEKYAGEIEGIYTKAENRS